MGLYKSATLRLVFLLLLFVAALIQAFGWEKKILQSHLYLKAHLKYKVGKILFMDVRIEALHLYPRELYS